GSPRAGQGEGERETGREREGMGVKGLKTYIARSFSAAAKKANLRKGDTLLIDGSGWVFKLLGDQGLEWGGDYGVIDKVTELFIQRLTTAGVTPVVFSDGPIRRMKRHTAKKRLALAAERWAKLEGLCLDGSRTESYHGYPSPPLMSKQLYSTLERLGVEVVECAEEADQALAIACAEQSDGRAFVYGDDSDFFLFKDCKYVQMVAEDTQGTDGLTFDLAAGTVSCEYWTR
ncbi:unnamed protein product, partial [Chrysoparadoxa australica]